MKNTDFTPWPADKTATLRRMWRAGFSASQISEVVGYTRNAVIGKVHRLGLSSAPRAFRSRSDSSRKRGAA